MPRARGWRAVLVLALLVGAACASGGSRTEAGDERLSVVASFYPVFEAAARVGGDRASVVNLTPPGAEPHDLELTPDQVDLLLDADAALYLGEGFQPAVEQVARSRDGATVDLLHELTEGEEQGDHEGEAEGGDDHVHEGIDPHVWLDPVLMSELIDLVAQSLSEADPEGVEMYEANAAAYREEVEALDGEFLTGLEACDRRLIVTAHDAFGRMAARYDLEVEPIAGISPEGEPDPARLAELADLVEREGVTTVFTETLVSADVAETLAREAGVETAVLNPLEGLTPEQAGGGETYLSVMRENLAALTAALGCE